LLIQLPRNHLHLVIVNCHGEVERLVPLRQARRIDVLRAEL